MNTKDIGDIGEAVTLSELIKLQISVYLPFGENSPCDLIADFNGKLNRIQVKTSKEVKDGKIVWNLVSSTTKKGSNVNHKYDNTEIDYFALYNIESNLLLLFPVDKPRASITFTYPFVYCKTASSNRNWEDYTIDKIIRRVTQIGEEDGLLNR